MSGPLFFDRVMETSTTTGTGTYTLAGAVTGYQSFAAIGNGNTCYYVAMGVDANGVPNGDWEVGLGTYTSSGTTLARTTVLASTNANAAVNWAAGTRRIAVTRPAQQAGEIIQVVNTQTGATVSGTTTTPLDDTIPQITEGIEFMTLAVTPTKSTNKLKIEVVLNLACTGTNPIYLTAALFQDATANALAAAVHAQSANDGCTMICFTHYMTAGTTSSTTFRVRGGGNGAGTTRMNGRAGARLMGGVMASSITVTEIAA